jgi:hypothetical protein
MRIKQSVFYILLVALLGCKDEFRPPVKSPSTGYLVVEGFINSGPEPTSISISRTIKVYDDSVRDVHEHNAKVYIEGHNQSFPLFETGDGIYTSGSLQLNTLEKYRLRIKTVDGKEYVSDFSNYRTTPEIDSLSWKRNSDGVKIYINTHDDQIQPGYYYWKYEETWEIHSTYYTSLEYLYVPGSLIPYGVSYRNRDQSPDTTLYKCWEDVLSSNINIGSSEKLSRDLIYFPIMSIDAQSRKLSVLYSIKVRQYAVSKDAYNYLKILKTNSEDIGSIFAPQPSELTGNIHCISNPSEKAIGFIEITQEKQSKRLFISNSELPGWGYKQQCAEYIIQNNPESVKDNGDLNPTTPYEFGAFGSIKSFYATPEITCMDCRLYGSSIKPAFWP